VVVDLSNFMLLSPDELGLFDGAGHVLTAAHGRFDLAVTVRALGNLNFIAVVKLQAVVNKRCIALCTGRIHSHTTF
jgi:hypothetical protein